MEDIFGGMEIITKVNGRMIVLKEKGNTFGKMEIIIKENIWIIKKTDMELNSIEMEIFWIKESGFKGNFKNDNLK